MQNILIQINQNGMGLGSDELGLVLIKNYLKLISEEDKLPRVITFYNAGVKLIAKESLVLDELKTLEDKGVKLVACKTCLMHFDLMESMKVGIQGTMMDIIELQKAANKVITL